MSCPNNKHFSVSAVILVCGDDYRIKIKANI